MPDINPDTMGAIHNSDMKLTIKEWSELHGLNPDSVRKAITRKTKQAHGILSVLTADEWEALRPGKSDTSAKRTPVVRAKKASVLPSSPAGQNVASPDIPKQETKPTFDFWQAVTDVLSGIRRAALDILLIGIVIGHAGLIWYDCAQLWDVPGQIGGGLAFFMVVAALMLATDPTKNITSQIALVLVGCIDVAAWYVHRPVFENYRADSAVTDVLCWFLCGMSFGALLIYRHQKNN